MVAWVRSLGLWDTVAQNAILRLYFPYPRSWTKVPLVLFLLKELNFFSIRLQQPALGKAGDQPLTVEEALYVLGKNILGKNVTDRLFPVAKTLAKGMGHIGK